MKSYLRPFSILCVYLFLLAVAIPWYWPADDRTIWWGLPAWTLVAYLASALISLFTVYTLALLFQDQADDSEQMPAGNRPGWTAPDETGSQRVD